MTTQTRLIWLVALSLTLQACAKETYLSAEPLATGGYLTQASVTTWRGGKGEAITRVKEEASTFCRREGREVVVKEIQTKFDANFSIETAQAEFDCVPVSSRKDQKL